MLNTVIKFVHFPQIFQRVEITEFDKQSFRIKAIG